MPNSEIGSAVLRFLRRLMRGEASLSERRREAVALKLRGNEHYVRQEMAAAERCYRAALQQDSDYAEARNNLGIVLLATGRFEEGWLFYEARYHLDLASRQNPIVVPTLPFPQWRGEPLTGKSLLVCPEQGFGDEIQFCRYVPVLKQMGVQRISWICKKPLFALFAGLDGLDCLFPDEDGVGIGMHDYWTFPLSLPLHCGTLAETIPNKLPYLTATEERMAFWRNRLPSGDGLRIGLVWKGSMGHHNDANRSISDLAVLAPLWRASGASFISLQTGAGEDQARQPPHGQPLIHLGSDVRDFADTAAIISQLDLVLCVDTAVAHLAGALGKPCWVMLPQVDTDWRWLRERSDSPWYPGVMRLFRQRIAGEWAEVIHELALGLEELSSYRVCA